MKKHSLCLIEAVLVGRWSLRGIGISLPAVLQWSPALHKGNLIPKPISSVICKFFPGIALLTLLFVIYLLLFLQEGIEKSGFWSLIWDFLCGKMTLSANKSRCDKEHKQVWDIFSAYFKEVAEKTASTSWGSNMPFVQLVWEFGYAGSGRWVHNVEFFCQWVNIAWVNHGSTVSFADDSKNMT